MTRKQKRLAIIGGGVSFIMLAVFLVMFAFGQSIAYFYMPVDLEKTSVAPGTRIRLGSTRARPGFRKLALQRATHELVNLPALPETDFQFCRMGIDVDQFRIEPQVQDVRGMAPVIQDIAVGKPHRVHQQPVAHAAAVDEPELLIRLGARGGRQSRPA